MPGHYILVSWLNPSGRRCKASGVVMMLFEKARENAAQIRQLGARAIAEARKAGVPAFYLDSSLGDGIVKEMPDGTRHLLRTEDGEDVIVRSFEPRR